jgi:hypothetical protein
MSGCVPLDHASVFLNEPHKTKGSELHEGAIETAVLLQGPAVPPPSNGGHRDITTLFQVATDTPKEPLDRKKNNTDIFRAQKGT